MALSNLKLDLQALQEIIPVLKKQGPRLTSRPGAAAVAASQREAAPGRSGCGEAAPDPGGFGGDGRGGGTVADGLVW